MAPRRKAGGFGARIESHRRNSARKVIKNSGHPRKMLEIRRTSRYKRHVKRLQASWNILFNVRRK